MCSAHQHCVHPPAYTQSTHARTCAYIYTHTNPDFSTLQFHKQQDGLTLAIEFGVISVLLLLYMGQRYLVKHGYIRRAKERYNNTKAAIRRRYRSVVEKVRRTSRIGAELFPHVVYFVFVFSLTTIFPGSMERVTSAGGLAVWAFLFNWYRSFRLLRSSPQDGDGQDKSDSDSQAQNSSRSRGDESPLSEDGSSSRDGNGKPSLSREEQVIRSWLQYWCVLSLVYVFVGIYRGIGAPAIVHRIVSESSVREIAFFVFIWLQLPLSSVSTSYKFLLVPFVRRYIKRIDLGKQNEEKTGILLRGLVMVGLLNSERKEILDDVIRESGIGLFSLLFFVTPSFITFYGYLLLGFVLPLTKTIIVASAKSTHRARIKWLTYWVALFGFVCIRTLLEKPLSLVPFVAHIQLAFVMWLQLPYFRGAAIVCEKTPDVVEFFSPKVPQRSLQPRVSASPRPSDENDAGSDNLEAKSNDQDQTPSPRPGSARRRRKKAE